MELKSYFATKRARHETRDGYLSILPWMIGFVLFFFLPVIRSVYYSFTEWSFMTDPIWIGLENYKYMFTNDPLFYKALSVTFNYVLLSLPIKLVLGILLALFLNWKIRGMNVYRTLFYIPAVVSGVSVSLMWMSLLQPDTGIVNTLLSYIGIQGPKWFWDPRWALISVASLSVWRVGGSAVIYLAGLQNIPPQLYEAADIDGASKYRQFWRITLPLLTPTLFFQLIIEMIGSFKVFTEAFVITQGGPLKATYFYLFYFYEEAFQNANTGYASALVVVLVIIIMFFTAITRYTSKHWVYYES